jgi:hypothetical protein
VLNGDEIAVDCGGSCGGEPCPLPCPDPIETRDLGDFEAGPGVWVVGGDPDAPETFPAGGSSMLLPISGECITGFGPEVVFEFYVETAGDYIIETQSELPEFALRTPVSVWVMEGECTPFAAEDACAMPDEETGGATLSATWSADQYVYIVVDAEEPAGADGFPWSLRVELD